MESKEPRNWFLRARTGFSVALFCKVEGSRNEHQDALEFPDGKVVMLTALVRNQRARVLQMPPKSKAAPNSEGRRSTSPEPEKLA